MSSEEAEIARLKRRVSELENELSSIRGGHTGRTKIKQMSAEVVDSNPYRSYFNIRLIENTARNTFICFHA